MDPISLLSNTIALIKAIKSQADLVSNNTEICQLLASRCEGLSIPLNSITSELLLRKESSYKLLLKKLADNLLECVEFMNKYGSSSWIRNKVIRFIRAGTIKNELESLIKKIDQSVLDLNLGLVVDMALDRRIAEVSNQQFQSFVTATLENLDADIVTKLNDIIITTNQATLADIQNDSETLMKTIVSIMSDSNAASSLISSDQLFTLSESETNDSESLSKEMADLSIEPSALSDHDSLSASRTALMASVLRYLQLEKSELFKIDPAIGTGTFGDVFKGNYMGFHVAIKFIKCYKALHSEDLRRVSREACIMALCKHPNVIELKAADLEEGVLVTDLAICNLDSLLHDRGKCPDITVDDSMKYLWAWDIAKALYYLHTHGVIHRDLKPANILIMSSMNRYVAKVSDFGVSTIVGLTMTARGTRSQAVGTSAYIAPELYDDDIPVKMRYTNAIDIYSFGIAVNEMFTNTIPWKDMTDIAIAKAVDKGKRPPLFIPANEGEYFLNQIIGDSSKGCLCQDLSQRPTAKEISKSLGMYVSEPSTSSSMEVVPPPAQIVSSPTSNQVLFDRSWSPYYQVSMDGTRIQLLRASTAPGHGDYNLYPVARCSFVISPTRRSITFVMSQYGWVGVGTETLAPDGFPGYTPEGFMIRLIGGAMTNREGDAYPQSVPPTANLVSKLVHLVYEYKSHSLIIFDIGDSALGATGRPAARYFLDDFPVPKYFVFSMKEGSCELFNDLSVLARGSSYTFDLDSNLASKYSSPTMTRFDNWNNYYGLSADRSEATIIRASNAVSVVPGSDYNSYPAARCDNKISRCRRTVVFSMSHYGWAGVGTDRLSPDGFPGYTSDGFMIRLIGGAMTNGVGDPFPAIVPDEENLIGKNVSLTYDYSRHSLIIQELNGRQSSKEYLLHSFPVPTYFVFSMKEGKCSLLKIKDPPYKMH